TFTSTNGSGDITSYQWIFGDDTLAASSTASDTTYQFSTPGTYEVQLLVTSSGGCRNGFNESFIIYSRPTQPSFNFSYNLLCTENEFQFTNTTDETGYDDALQYTWQFADEGTSSQKDTTFAFSTAGERIISLVSEIPGCTSDPTYDTININPTPNIDFDYSVVCEGLPTQFGNVSVSQNLESFTWDFGDGYFNTNENPEHLYEGNGQYEVIMAVVDEDGCINQIQKTVVVDQIPTPTFSVEGNIACSESEVQFIDETDNSVANVTQWAWDFGDGNTDDVMNPTHHYAESGEYNVSLTVFNDASCEATFDSLIVVDQTPLVDFEFTVGCINEETSFNDQSSGDITSWFWNIGEEVSTEQNPTIIFETAGLYDVSLEITTSDFCVISTTKQVVVNDLPVVNFEIQNSCLNELISFNDNSEEFGDPIISRSWNFGDGFSADGSTVYHEYLVSGTYQVTLEAITRNGCVLETSETLEISPAPTASFSVDNTFGAPPLSIAISNESAGASQYAWLLNNDTISTEENTLLTLTEVGQPELTLLTKNEFGCIDSVSQEFIIASPQYDLNLIDFEIVQNDESFSLVLDFINSSNLPVSNFDVNVEFDNEFTLTESYEGQVDIGERIVYQLEVEIPSNQNISYICTELETPNSDFIDINPANNEKCIDFTSEISVEPPLPNPTSSSSLIKVVLPDRMDITLVVTDMSGNIIDEINYNNLSKGLQNIEVDLTSLNKGMYLLQIIHENGKEVQRIQKR
ncbi:MAG: PKD domain-containing protein, partial [bacterium]|nr:PKD domain-containing protein [bacterium]